ncbi:hypothetical protein Zmor_027593 [Zophobas morio]|uniref:Lipase n=1 Tax=Zophobas morio TaxID=2755281 RepID=A0AA38HNI9_9CUCU|nr:hypothetical protein Zmor_027593 [Zophobas morio]
MNLLTTKTTTAVWILLCFQSPTSADDEDRYLTLPQIISKYNYPVEIHHVTTQDGYTLTMYRIPGTSTARPVLLLHGIFHYAAAFITAGVGHALGYILADAGYDVWLGSFRGCPDSQTHTIFNATTDPKFWDFSWHEMGLFDLPAMIDYVLEITAQPSLYYVAHSQGTTAFYAMVSTHVHYNRKVRVNFSLAPTVYFSKPIKPLVVLEMWYHYIQHLADKLDVYTIPPSNRFVSQTLPVLCGRTGRFCDELRFTFMKYFHGTEVPEGVLPVLVGHAQMPVATKQILHFLQVMRSGYFHWYDYGEDRCWGYGCGSRRVRAYNLSAVAVPTFLFYSARDCMIHEDDVVRLCGELGGGCEGRVLVPDRSFNHGDFISGKRVRELVFDKVVTLMGQY